MFTDRGTDKKDVAYIHNGALLSHKKDKMLFSVTWMDLEIFILSEIRCKRQTSYDDNVEFKTMLQMILFTKQDTENKLMVTKGERQKG